MFNLSIAFPELSTSEIRSKIHHTYRHFGMILIDFFRMSSLTNKNLSSILHMDDETKSCLSKKGGIIMSGHLGNWEMFIPALGLNGYQLGVVTQTQRNSGVDRIFSEIRNFKNITLISRIGSRKQMLQCLKSGAFLGLASDQNAGKRGIDIPFFGRNASTPKGAAIFHLKTDAPIFIGFCILLPDFSYRLSLRELSTKDLPAEQDEAIYEINSRFIKILEENIRQYPEQYFWFHRRWSKQIYKDS